MKVCYITYIFNTYFDCNDIINHSLHYMRVSSSTNLIKRSICVFTRYFSWINSIIRNAAFRVSATCFSRDFFIFFYFFIFWDLWRKRRRMNKMILSSRDDEVTRLLKSVVANSCEVNSSSAIGNSCRCRLSDLSNDSCCSGRAYYRGYAILAHFWIRLCKTRKRKIKNVKPI